MPSNSSYSKHFNTSSGEIQQHKACKEGYLAKTLDRLLVNHYWTITVSEEAGIYALVAMIEAWLIDWIHTRLKIPMEKVLICQDTSAYGLSSMKAVRLQSHPYKIWCGFSALSLL